MSTDRTPDDIAEWDAAYVLGALSVDERRTYEQYLAANPARAAEVNAFADLPDILDVLSPKEALALLDAPPAAAQAPQAEVVSLDAQRQRRSRRATVVGAVAVAAALAVLGGVVGATIFPRTSSSVQTVAMSPMQPGQRPGLTAQLAVTEKQWGTELNWACEYTKDWARDVDSYDLVVTTRDGAQTAVGSWRPAGDEATGLSAATSIPTAEISSIDIRVSGTDQPLAVRTF